MRVLLFSLLLASAAFAAAPTNVVIILADDLGFGDLSCYGHPKFKTPRIDGMAAEGVMMRQFNTPAPYCAPTRAALLTGRYPFRCRMMQNPAPDGGPEADALAMPQSELTLAQVLKAAGYTTGMVGKWHLGHKAGFLPTERGFDSYFGIPYSNDMRPVQLLEGTQRVEYPVVQATLTQRYTERAVKFIKENKSRPFFLYLSHAIPHKPLAVSEAFYKKSGAGLYGDVMMELDASVGSVLDALKAEGVDEQTLVMFSSDNGAWLGGSTGGLRGMKTANWEGAYRVPGIARWPGRIPAGQVSDALAVTMDFFSTALAATGAKMPDDRELDGKDLLPVWAQKAASPHDYVLGHQGSKLHTIRDARWKLHVLPSRQMQFKLDADGRWQDFRAPDGVTILAPTEQANVDQLPGVTTGDKPTKMMLFDLQADPSEQHNVAKSYPEEVKRLKAAFDPMNALVPEEQMIQRSR
jgi:arylsulfatase A-like enzyme